MEYYQTPPPIQALFKCCILATLSHRPSLLHYRPASGGGGGGPESIALRSKRRLRKDSRFLRVIRAYHRLLGDPLLLLLQRNLHLVEFFWNAGQGFTPYIITVNAGEDINHKIMSFMQQSRQEICIISASGVISNASLCQPASSGGNITYEGRFDILSLCGSYVHSDFTSRTGGLSICLSSNDGQIIGGGVDGPLIAAGPVQVILGAFVISSKNSATFPKDDASVGASVSSLGFPSPPARNSVVGSDDNHQNSDGYPFMIPNEVVPVTSPQLTDWRSNNDSRTTAVRKSEPWSKPFSKE